MPLTKRPLLRYFLLAYLAFWVLLAVTGGAMALRVPDPLITILKNVCAWSPTLVIMFQFRHFYPGTTMAQYFKRNFATKVNPLLFLFSLIAQFLIFAFALDASLLSSGASLDSISFASLSPLLPTFVIVITSGPMGEELGWRGFALGQLQKRFTPLASALILGVFWGFWHAPLWFASGYSGIKLLTYVFFFLIAIVSTSVVIAFFYNRGKNILIAMWIHFLFDFLLSMTKTSVDLLSILGYEAGGYFVLSVILVLIDRKAMLAKPDRTGDTAAANSVMATQQIG